MAENRGTCDRGFEDVHALPLPNESLSVGPQALIKRGEDVLRLH